MLLAILHFVLHPTATPGSAVGGRSWLMLCSRGCFGFVSLKIGCFCAATKMDVWAEGVGVCMLAPNCLQDAGRQRGKRRLRWSRGRSGGNGCCQHLLR